MTKFISKKDCDWAFYEAMENGTRESMADYYESLNHHYKRRGKRIKQLLSEIEELKDSLAKGNYCERCVEEAKQEINDYYGTNQFT